MRIEPPGAVPGGEVPIRRHQLDVVGSMDALRFFPQVVYQLHGDPLTLLGRAQIDPAILSDDAAVLEYRCFVGLMQQAAETLECPAFGLRLAAEWRNHSCQGPLGLAMKNSKNLGDALTFCVRNCHAFSTAAHLHLERHRENEVLLRVELMPDHVVDKRQSVENALLRANLTILQITGGAVHAREVHFSHLQMSEARIYRSLFECPVYFGRKDDGIVLGETDLVRSTVCPVPWIYEMASLFIESRYPRPDPSVTMRVRRLVVQSLGTDACTNDRVAASLCMHPRTLHRRLRVEGTSFEDVRSEVRRDAALYYLREGFPIARIAEMLGFADASVLSRSCYRWFSDSPTELRKRLKGGAEARPRPKDLPNYSWSIIPE